jgi:AcrR family transcriptional regulator
MMQVLTRSHEPTVRPAVEETRSRILAAAREVFERNGTRGTTTREVAIRAGVNEATLFRHFGSKAALLSAMREQACGLDTIGESLANLPGVDIGAELREVARAAVAGLHGQRELLCISLVESAIEQTEPDTPEWRGPNHVQTLLTAYFARLVNEGRLAGDPDLLARTFIGIMFQYVIARRLWRSHAIDPATVDALVDIFLHGVER